MADLYPLLLRPVFKERVWGGRGLEAFFPDSLPPGPIGEAWVLAEHDHGTNVVVNGPLTGCSLSDVRRDYGAALLGIRATHEPGGRCPILMKLLDARDDLSVQVHPHDGYEGLAPGELGKTEMWLVLDAEPGAEIVLGLKEGIDAASFRGMIHAGRVRDCLQHLPVRPGDVFYVPAGTVHALGKGTLVAEVQQSSDTVYRLYDYDRLGVDGKPRELHINHALKVARYDTQQAHFRPEAPTANQWQVLIENPYFIVERGLCGGVWPQHTNLGSFEALLVYEGQGSLAWVKGREELRKGQTVLVPAGLGAYTIEGGLEVLRARVPVTPGSGDPDAFSGHISVHRPCGSRVPGQAPASPTIGGRAHTLRPSRDGSTPGSRGCKLD